MTTPGAPFSRIKAVSGLPSKGTMVSIEAGPEERERLARDLDILSVDALSATFTLTPWRKTGVRVAGEVRGRVKQACVVTLDPVDEEVVETVDRTFLPGDEIGPIGDEIEIDAEADDPPEALEGSTLDLGVIASEHLALGLDPYPRAPGAGYGDLIEDDGSKDEEPSPFAALAKLKPAGDP